MLPISKGYEKVTVICGRERSLKSQKAPYSNQAATQIRSKTEKSRRKVSIIVELAARESTTQFKDGPD